jgi:hypothetical protein
VIWTKAIKGRSRFGDKMPGRMSGWSWKRQDVSSCLDDDIDGALEFSYFLGLSLDVDCIVRIETSPFSVSLKPMHQLGRLKWSIYV